MRPPPPPIGSPEWNRELESFGVSRALVDAFLQDALGDADPTTISPHEITLAPGRVLLGRPDGAFAVALHASGLDASPDSLDDGGEHQREARALKAAAWFLFHERQPTYGTMMNLRNEVVYALDGGSPLARWCVRQLAAGIVHGPPEVSDSIWYYLAVDPFETREESLTLFPQLADELPEALYESLLDASATVTWEAKRDFYACCAADPALHEPLAQALLRSSDSGFYTSVHAREGLSLVHRLTLADGSLRATIVQALSLPTRAWIAAVADVDDARFRAERPGACVVALAWLGETKSWLWDSELWSGPVVVGRFLRSKYGVYPDGTNALPWTLRREALSPPPPGAREPIEWHVVRGSSAALAALVGTEIELSGPGMR